MAGDVPRYVGDNTMLHCGDPIFYTNLNTSYWQSHFIRMPDHPNIERVVAINNDSEIIFNIAFSDILSVKPASHP